MLLLTSRYCGANQHYYFHTSIRSLMHLDAGLLVPLHHVIVTSGLKLYDEVLNINLVVFLFNIHSVSVISSMLCWLSLSKEVYMPKIKLSIICTANHLGSILLLVALYHSLVTGTDQKNPLVMGLLLPKKKGCEKKRKKKSIKSEM